jgi:hypothetical protein
MSKKSKKRTTIIVDDMLWIKFRKKCIDERISANKKIEELIKKWV